MTWSQEINVLVIDKNSHLTIWTLNTRNSWNATISSHQEIVLFQLLLIIMWTPEGRREFWPVEGSSMYRAVFLRSPLSNLHWLTDRRRTAFVNFTNDLLLQLLRSLCCFCCCNDFFFSANETLSRYDCRPSFDRLNSNSCYTPWPTRWISRPWNPRCQNRQRH